MAYFCIYLVELHESNPDSEESYRFSLNPVELSHPPFFPPMHSCPIEHQQPNKEYSRT